MIAQQQHHSGKHKRQFRTNYFMMIKTMHNQSYLHPDRLFSPVDKVRGIARDLYDSVVKLPLICPHGHTDPSWFANNLNFSDATELLIKPDHYIFRMLYSQGVPLESLGIKRRDAQPVETDNRKIWHTFAQHYHLFRGTPCRIWLDTTFHTEFGMKAPLHEGNADEYFDSITAKLATDAFKPRALYERFHIEVIATTESPLDDLRYHKAIRDSDWNGKVISAFRPDAVVDPDYEGFSDNLVKLGEITGENTHTWEGYLAALRNRRSYFASLGATSTDHGHPSATTADLDLASCKKLFVGALAGTLNHTEAELFRGQMLTEMAGMSIEDGMVMQLHPASYRNHNAQLFTGFGRDKGADIPQQVEFTRSLKPLLDKYGNDTRLSLILFTLDESVYSRELAPLAGHYPALKIGPPWWFHDSPEGMQRYRQQITETAGFYNTVGFNDDTRALLSIPARHDVARRMDCNFLAEMVADHRLRLDEAHELAYELSYGLAKKAYKL